MGVRGETQWNDAQVRFGPYDSTCTLSDNDDDEEEKETKSCIGNDDAEEEGESYGASADFHMDHEKFSFVFPHPNQQKKACITVDGNDENDNVNRMIRIELEGYHSKSNITYCSTGLTMWPAAQNLCDHLIKHPNLIQGKRVLELGSGLGLCGLLAHRMSEKNTYVHMTDGDTDVLGHLRKNIAFNSRTTMADNKSNISESGDEVCSTLKCNQLLWSRENAIQFLQKKSDNIKYDLIFASDIVYAMCVVEPMWETVQELLKRDGGIFLFAFARRQVPVTMQHVLEAAGKAGFMYEECEETDPEKDLFVYNFRWK